MDCLAAKDYFKVSPERIPPPGPEKVLEASRSMPPLDIIALCAPQEDLGAPGSEQHSGSASGQTSGADTSIILLNISQRNTGAPDLSFVHPFLHSVVCSLKHPLGPLPVAKGSCVSRLIYFLIGNMFA